MDRYKFVRSLASLTLVTGALVLGGCFDKPPNVDYDAGPPDAEVPDAAPPCQPSTTVCDDTAGVYVECDSTGMPAVVMQCPLGCASDAEKCLDVDPSNGLASYLDRARDDDTVIDVALTGTATVDTTTGEFSVNGTPLSVTTEVFNGIRIFMFKTLTVSGTLKATGSLPLALVADGDIAITGLIDVSADGTAQGPGAVTEDSSCMGSLHGVSGPHPDPTPGGGGGGHYSLGATGGGDGAGDLGYPGGDQAADDDVVPLIGGCRGGGVNETISIQPVMYAFSGGGGGGGAVQIVSRHTIVLTEFGRIDASGGGGQSGTHPSGTIGGAGGGAGGVILLEAPVVTLDGTGVVLSTKGGGGASAGNGAATHQGKDGGTDMGPAVGGTGVSLASGGAGGTETSLPVAGSAGTTTGKDGGGGGGSVGQSRINTASGAAIPLNGATIRSRNTTGAVGARVVP